LGACKGNSDGQKAAAGTSGKANDNDTPTVVETEYTPIDNRLRVLLKVAPGARVTPTTRGRWNMDSYVTESGDVQFNVTLEPAPDPGSDVV